MTTDRQVLIIDDEPSWVELLSRELKRHAYEVRVAYDAAEGRRAIEQDGFDGVVLLDLRLPDGDGLDLLEPFLKTNPSLRIVMMTAHGTHADEHEARQRGVYLFVSKHEPKERFVGAVKNAFQDRAQADQIKAYRDLVERRYQFRTIMSDSPRMQHVFEMLMQIVDSRVTVLLQGESGTGKELVARALHYEGPRKGSPFVAVNCGGIPEALLESELFGHERGAFTGAVAAKKGKFELADGGTLFLDEIGEMPLHLQVKLLRVLQERQVERVGGAGPRPIDVRIVSATHRDLMEMVREKRFREDLYYRLAVFPVQLPALREREGDIPLLARHFLKKALAEEKKEQPSRISWAAMAALESYAFPGNVRELENIISRAVLVCSAEAIEPRDLPMSVLSAGALSSSPPTVSDNQRRPEVSGPRAELLELVRVARDEPHLSLGQGLEVLFPKLEDLPRADEVEFALIERALALSGGNVNEAARVLGLSRATIYRRLRRERPEPDDPGAAAS